MRFAQGEMFHWFWVVIALVFFLLWANKRQDKIRDKFIASNLFKDVALNFHGHLRRYQNILILMVFIFSIIALARPQWGFQWREVKRQGLDIIVVIDTSKSMLTQDVRPNRLERTKLAVQDLLKKLKGDRIGLMAFAGNAFLVCPLTVDYGGYLLSLNDLDVATVPRGGTNIEEAIEEAMKGYQDVASKYKAVIIVTDGDNLEGDPLKAARLAKEKGVKVYTIGIGTKEGELIQIESQNGQRDFLKDDQGNFVKSRLNESLLQEIALAADGIYVKSSGAEFGLDYIYEHELSSLEKREIESSKEKRFYERFQIPLTIAFIFLLIETCLLSIYRKQKAV
ncbi:MAG: VWA domain-containing protein [Candidatus Omnitrophica bacterium]|nr:VWA domain-containing protein [Candidatus Omnitrophota bacterium]